MANLTDTQLVLLSNAAQRDDGVVVMPDRLKGSAAAKVAKVLLGRGLIDEVQAKNGMPTWRRDEEQGRSLALVITSTGRAAINVESGPKPGGADGDAKHSAVSRTSTGQSRARRPGRKGAPPKINEKKTAAEPRAGSKQALVVKMLQRSKGATIDDLTKATKWLPHTTRAALTGLRKRGHRIERERAANGGTVYRIVAADKRRAA